MRINFGKIFQEKSKDRLMDGLVNIPQDSSLWPPAWKEVVYKQYQRFTPLPLPPAAPRVFGHEDLMQRTSTRSFGKINEQTKQNTYRSLTLQEISNILFFSCGEVKKGIDPTKSTRIQPSAGARYPIEAYILNFEPGDLGIACYHYNVVHHTLEALWPIPLTSRADISTYFGYSWSTDASMAIVLTGVTQRTTMKYGERGYRYMYLEAGAILNNIQNNSLLEKIGSVILGSTNEIQIEDLLDLDGEQETVIMGILLG